MNIQMILGGHLNIIELGRVGGLNVWSSTKGSAIQQRMCAGKVVTELLQSNVILRMVFLDASVSFHTYWDEILMSRQSFRQKCFSGK